MIFDTPPYLIMFLFQKLKRDFGVFQDDITYILFQDIDRR